jgi:hypothetical protein
MIEPTPARPNGQGNGWIPPPWTRLLTWAIRDVGFPAALAIVLIGVLLGWVRSPLDHLAPIRAVLDSHEVASQEFQAALLEYQREQRCLFAIPQEDRLDVLRGYSQVCDYALGAHRLREREPLPAAPSRERTTIQPKPRRSGFTSEDEVARPRSAMPQVVPLPKVVP